MSIAVQTDPRKRVLLVILKTALGLRVLATFEVKIAKIFNF